MNRWLVDGCEVVIADRIGLTEATGYVKQIKRADPSVRRVTIIDATCGEVEICAETNPAPFRLFERGANVGRLLKCEE